MICTFTYVIVGLNPTRGHGCLVCCECCVLSGRGLCDGLISRPEESYRLWCVVVCDLENLVNEEALAHWGLSRQKQTNKTFEYVLLFLDSIAKFRKATVSFVMSVFPSAWNISAPTDFS
jgi:hypothetical protein